MGASEVVAAAASAALPVVPALAAVEPSLVPVSLVLDPALAPESSNPKKLRTCSLVIVATDAWRKYAVFTSANSCWGTLRSRKTRDSVCGVLPNTRMPSSNASCTTKCTQALLPGVIGLTMMVNVKCSCLTQPRFDVSDNGDDYYAVESLVLIFSSTLSSMDGPRVDESRSCSKMVG
ncbi:hypothetical protein PR003_g7390 [Phytophthora rubi]|uniref:Uncharacterized protein n=1 Tax=Phytophthora rubi TaxID=129364 RepID=A0A6A4FK08_9STRA|nr:hypothetical protein PR002_g567 [Phytophthora rubi]KAE9346518.1 hypothetical protein PR003_g7390 [Phytophthora rubi]